MTDKLIERIIELQNPTVVGLDPQLSYVPEKDVKDIAGFEDAGKAILKFNKTIIDEIYDIVPAVKPQIAYYEMYGVEGIKAFLETIKYAKEKGLIVISDVKRNDIGSTAACYSSAYLGETKLGGFNAKAFPSDFVTVNGYLGTDGIEPFVKDIKTHGKGIFVLVKTSNPSSDEFQDLTLAGGKTVYEYMGALVEKWGADSIGRYGYSAVGAVVGATKPAQAKRLRGNMPHTMFLVPGYGAQGGTASDLTVCFDDRGLGAIVNSSRGVICAESPRQAAIDMKQDLLNALKSAGIKRIINNE